MLTQQSTKKVALTAIRYCSWNGSRSRGIIRSNASQRVSSLASFNSITYDHSLWGHCQPLSVLSGSASHPRSKRLIKTLIKKGIPRNFLKNEANGLACECLVTRRDSLSIKCFRSDNEWFSSKGRRRLRSESVNFVFFICSGTTKKHSSGTPGVRMISTQPIFASTSLPTCKKNVNWNRMHLNDQTWDESQIKTYLCETAIVPNFLQIRTLTWYHPFQICNQNVNRTNNPNTKWMRRSWDMLADNVRASLGCRCVDRLT